MEIGLFELLWLAGGTAVTLILAIALAYWIRQESRALPTRKNAAQPPPPTSVEEWDGPSDEPASRPRGD